MKKVIAVLGFLLWANGAVAEVKGQKLDYSSGGAKLQGYFAEDTSRKGRIPAILIVHDWMGLGEFTRGKANELARMGYRAFAVDLYGIGVRPKDNKEAAQMSGELKENRKLLRERMRAAYDLIAARKDVDSSKIIAIGYCFGGTAALELARSGAPLAGTVSFHGNLANPSPQDAKKIQGQVLILHGEADPFVPPQEVNAFKEEMNQAGISFRFISYPGAVHGFTNPKAGKDPSKGMAYNAEADQKSWLEFERFLKGVNIP